MINKNYILRCSAFTLMEILIAIGIIMLMAALALPAYNRIFGRGKKAAAISQIASFDMCITDYQIDTGKLPKGLDGLVKNDGNKKWDGPYISKSEVPLDPWGNKYLYEINTNGAGYKITSYGSDGKVGGKGDASDITNQ